MAGVETCYVEEVFNGNEIWKSGAIFMHYGPLLCLQVAFNITICNIFHYILKPLHQPRLIAEILAGMSVGLFLSTDNVVVRLFLPTEGILIIETFANVGIMFYVFLSGLEMNLGDILNIERKAASIAMAGIIIPMMMGVGFYAVTQKIYQESPFIIFRADQEYKAKAYLFWSLTLTITGFPVLARILADLKLLHTGLGKTALTTAMISDAYGWLLFIILIPFANNNMQALWSVLGMIVFIAFCILVLRPVMARYIEGDKNQEEEAREEWDDSLLLLVLMGALACSFVTDMLGTHSIVGAFVYGLVLPHGRFADFVMKKLDDFVSFAMSPNFFFRSGLTVNFFMIAQQKYWFFMVFIILFLSIPKVVSTLVATFFFGVPVRDGVGIGLLLNSKGILALIILTIVWDRKILSVVDFSIMVCAVLVMTIMVPLFVNAIYKPRKRYEKYTLRTIEKSRIDSELRVLCYVLNIRQATNMVNVLGALNATRISPLQVFGVHLVELVGRATALFAAQISHTPSNSEAHNSSQLKSDNIGNTFNALAETCSAIRVETLNVVSPYETIHQDIQNLAEQKRTALILIPFHKDLEAHNGDQEASNEACKNINQNVLQDAPCSVAIFVDRGGHHRSLSSSAAAAAAGKANLHIMTLFIGGPDDREALSISWRMARHPGNRLSMVRILLVDEAARKVETEPNHDELHHWLSAAAQDDESQKLLDEECIDSFRFKGVYNNDSITYSEEEVHNGEELVSLLHELDKDDCDLCIVGRGSGRSSAMFVNFMEWCDNPELGVIGDIMISKSFGSRSSLLSVQQFGSRAMMFGKKDFSRKNNDHAGSDHFV